MKNPVPTFVITLERNLHRGRHVQQSLASHGVQAELWMGVDGTQPIEFIGDEVVDEENFFIGFMRKIQRTEIGCYLAHYRLLQHALKKGWERILVFEDDTSPLPNFKHVLPQLLKLDSSYEHINLQPHIHPWAIVHHRYELTQQLQNEHILIRTVKHTLGTRGYAVSHDGIRKMLAGLMPITAPIDESMDFLIWHHELRCFDVWPELLFHSGVNILQHRSIDEQSLIQRIRTFPKKRSKKFHQKISMHGAMRNQLLKTYIEKCLQEYNTSSDAHAK